MTSDLDLYTTITRAVMEVSRLRGALQRIAYEGRNLLPDATDDQATVIEQWAAELLRAP